jgi:hypothetical protein
MINVRVTIMTGSIENANVLTSSCTVRGTTREKESDGQGVGDDESEDALFEADHQRQPGNFPPEGAANRLQL